MNCRVHQVARPRGLRPRHRWWSCGSSAAGCRAGRRGASAARRCNGRAAMPSPLELASRPCGRRRRPGCRVCTRSISLISSASRTVTRRRRVVSRGVVGARGDLRRGLAQHGADRLDPELAALDDAGHRVVDDHRDRQAEPDRLLDFAVELRCRERAADVRRISFARRSSRTSRSSSTIRVASSVVVPGRRPPSISACRTQVRNASG